MNIWILYDTQFGNGKKLAKVLGKEFPEADDIRRGDVKDVSPKSIAEDNPDVIILGGAIRMFRGAPKSKKWLKKLNKHLEELNHKIRFGTAFLTHGLPTDKVQGYGKRYLKKMKKSSMIENTYRQLLTARVKEQEGPILSKEMDKAKNYIHEFINWIKN